MMRKIKRQDNKQGVILITVVFILAIAMIFIAAAMMLTQATRERTYAKAEQSQARLTVTAAAEAFYQALSMQEFTDSNLEALSLGMSASNPIKMVVTDQVVPGMTEDADNCTTLYLSQETKSGVTYIHADFTTTIGDQKENVSIIFTASTTKPKTGLFTNQVDLNGNFKDEFFTVLGSVPAGMAQPKDNTVVVRGGWNQAYTGNNLKSNFVFTDGDVYLGHDSNFTGDLIFLNDAVLHLSGGSATQVTSTGNFYFVGDDNSDAIVGADSGRTWGSGTYTFLGRSASNSGSGNSGNYVFDFLNAGGKKVLFIDTNGSWNASLGTGLSSASNDATITNWSNDYSTNKTTYTDIIANAKDYSSADYDSTNSFPTATEAFSTLGLSQTHTGATMSFGNFLSSYSYNTSGACVPAGTYNFTGGYNSGEGGYNFGSRIPYVIVLDGTQDYTFYFSTGSSNDYVLTGVIFVVINQTKNVTQTMVLEKGVNLTFAGNDNWDMAQSGIFSVTRGLTSAADAYKYIVTDNKLKAEFNSDSYSAYYDSKHKPTLFVYGAGNNKLRFGKGGCAEAYIGLFDDDYTVADANKSQILFGNDYHYIYGRIQAAVISAGGSSARLVMPYCPDPTSSDPDPYTLLVSKYKIYDFRYYYS